MQLEFQYLTTLNTKLHKLTKILYLLKLNFYCMYARFNSNKLCLCPLGNIYVFRLCFKIKRGYFSVCYVQCMECLRRTKNTKNKVVVTDRQLSLKCYACEK